MPEHKKATPKKQEGPEQKHHAKQEESRPLADQSHERGQVADAMAETPFRPSMDQHAALLARAHSDEHRANLVLHLQRTYGNTYVQRLLGSTGIQAKLRVNPPNDVYEQEADRVADVVTRGVMSQTQRQAEEEEEEAQAKSILQRQEEEELEAMPKPVGSEQWVVSDDVEARINNERGGGQPLNESVRESLELQFDRDFSNVRVHTDAEAQELSQELGATAFTTGRDIFFREGTYQPESESGKWLLAHELTHVVQQNEAGVRRQKLDREELAQAEPVRRQDEGEQAEEGTLPEYVAEPEEEVEKGPDDRHKFDGARLGSSTSSAGTATATQLPNYRITVGKIGFEFNDSTTPAVDSSDREESDRTHEDTVTAGTVGVEWTNPGGKKVSAFGSESFKPGYKGVKYKKDGKGNVTLDFTLNIKCPWGVNSGGNTDVPSANDAVVTKATYKKIAKDLTPEKDEKSWVAPREKYWSKAICERHEKFHSTDDKKWSEGTGKKVVTDYLKGKTISGWFTWFGVRKLLKKAMKEMSKSNWEFYSGGVDSYYSYAGEERAFGDGKEPYQKLAKAVDTQGKKLEKAAKKK